MWYVIHVIFVDIPAILQEILTFEFVTGLMGHPVVAIYSMCSVMCSIFDTMGYAIDIEYYGLSFYGTSRSLIIVGNTTSLAPCFL